MRTIKFRVIDKLSKKWVHGFNYTNDDFNSIGQFTGLHDKNGKEIYEGDILKEITNPCAPDFKAQFNELHEFWEVRWDERENGFNSFPIASKDIDIDKAVEQLGGEILWPSKYVLTNHWHFEIIGNIHENPELCNRSYASSRI